MKQDCLPSEKHFHDYIQNERYLKKNTVDQHISNLRLISVFFKDKKFTLKNARLLVGELMQKKKPGTVQGYIISLRVLCEYLISRGQIKGNFAKDLKMPRREKPIHEILSVQEIKRILDQALLRKNLNRRQFWWLYFSLLAKTGARLSEISQLQRNDINIEKNTLLIRHSKTGQPREIPIPQDLIKSLQEQLRKSQSKWIFTPYKGNHEKPLQGSGIRDQLKRLAKKAGIRKKVYPHLLRHSYITNALANNIELPKLSRIVGHTDLKSTAVYTHLVVDDLRDAVQSHPLNTTEKKISIEERLGNMEKLLITNLSAVNGIQGDDSSMIAGFMVKGKPFCVCCEIDGKDEISLRKTEKQEKLKKNLICAGCGEDLLDVYSWEHGF